VHQQRTTKFESEGSFRQNLQKYTSKKMAVARVFCNFPSGKHKNMFFGLISLPGRRNSILTPVLEVRIFENEFFFDKI
jgi:hypothetical protein